MPHAPRCGLNLIEAGVSQLKPSLVLYSPLHLWLWSLEHLAANVDGFVGPPGQLHRRFLLEAPDESCGLSIDVLAVLNCPESVPTCCDPNQLQQQQQQQQQQQSPPAKAAEPPSTPTTTTPTRTTTATDDAGGDDTGGAEVDPSILEALQVAVGGDSAKAAQLLKEQPALEASLQTSLESAAQNASALASVPPPLLSVR
jgi:hypothetical protein